MRFYRGRFVNADAVVVLCAISHAGVIERLIDKESRLCRGDGAFIKDLLFDLSWFMVFRYSDALECECVLA